MKVILYGFGNPDNRGCEAIVKSVSSMIKAKYENSYIIALSNDYGRVPMLKIDTIDEYGKGIYPHENTIQTFIARVIRKIFKSAVPFYTILNIKNFRNAQDAVLCISVGGDNYCYNTKNDWLYAMDKKFHEKNKTLIHWGSSFEKSLLDDRMVKDLNQFDLIIVRESLSRQYLLEKNITVPITLIPDPAFILKPEKLDEVCLSKDTVGINISPLIMRYTTSEDLVYKNVINMINYIIEKCGLKVALIPHVCDRRTGIGDYTVLSDIMKGVRQKDDCTLIDYTYSAEQYKYIISKCRMFIGARTHSTIAAYSTFVPTLVIGYSVKAKGIAKDIFGTYENYVIPVQSLQSEEDLTNGFIWLYKNEDKIREHLHSFMPGYIERAYQAIDKIDEIVGSR